MDPAPTTSRKAIITTIIVIPRISRRIQAPRKRDNRIPYADRVRQNPLDRRILNDSRRRLHHPQFLRRRQRSRVCTPGQASKAGKIHESQGIRMHLLNPSMRTQEPVHGRGFPDMNRNTAHLNIDQRRKKTTLSTGKTVPAFAQKPETDTGSTDRLPQPHKMIHQSKLREDHKIT
jgi:hypothetical protein